MFAKPCHTRPHRPWALWLAVLIAVFGALAPTVSHALVLARGAASPMQEICTSTGPGWVALHIPAETSQDQESAPSLEHCPFCLLGADRALLVAHPWAHRFGVSPASERPTVWWALSLVIPFALTPPPRGPPQRA